MTSGEDHGGHSDRRDLSPREALERFINHRRSEYAEGSIQNYRYRLKLFVEWCEGNGIESVSELDVWDLDTYRNDRQAEGIKTITLHGEMKTLRLLLRYLERIEVVEEGLSEKIDVPRLGKDEESSDAMLDPADALPLIEKFRLTPNLNGTRRHAFLELAWYTGARLSGLRGLDLRDYHPEDDEVGPYVEFRHRPSEGTPLKNGVDGERPVGIPPSVADVVDRYIEKYRDGVHDDYRRSPLLTTQVGRPSSNTIRTWSYLATIPCIYRECPHDRDPDTCSYIHRNHASKCPSSRSPHRIRTGSITWQRDLGFPPEVLAERVNASLEVIEQHYDKASALDRLANRRRGYVDQMEFDQ